MSGVLPSGAWLGLGQRLWELLPPSGRAVFIGYLALPASNRIAALASFWLTIRAIRHAMTTPLTTQEEVLTGLGVFFSFAMASTLFWAAGRCELSLKSVFSRLVREVFGRWLARLRDFPEEERRAEVLRFQRREPELAGKSADMLFDFASLCANSVLVAALTTAVLAVSPIVGGFLVVGGLVALLGLRARAPREPRSVGQRKEAVRDLREAARELACGETPEEEAMSRYRENEFDRFRLLDLARRRQRQGKVLALVGLGTALLMTVLYFFASEGWFEGMDPIWIIVLVLGVRTCVAHGRMALDKWSSLLSDRDHLGRFRNLVMEVA